MAAEGQRRSKRKAAVSSNISRASDADKERMREKRISKLESDATDYVDVDGDDDDEDFDGSESDDGVTSKKRKTKRRSTRTQGGKRQAVNLSKNFTELLEIMEYDKYPKHVPNYLSATTAPPRRPPRHFCVVCGEAGPYTHPLDGARLCFKSSEGRKCYEIYTETKARFGYGR